MSDKVTSLELSEKLKEAGAKQESEWWWTEFYNRSSTVPDERLSMLADIQEMVDMRDERDYIVDLDVYSAFDCHELLERLPTWSAVEGRQLGDYIVRNDFLGREEFGPTPAEALGKLYLWCLENGHCEKER